MNTRRHLPQTSSGGNENLWNFQATFHAFSFVFLFSSLSIFHWIENLPPFTFHPPLTTNAAESTMMWNWGILKEEKLWRDGKTFSVFGLHISENGYMAQGSNFSSSFFSFSINFAHFSKEEIFWSIIECDEYASEWNFMVHLLKSWLKNINLSLSRSATFIRVIYSP